MNVQQFKIQITNMERYQALVPQSGGLLQTTSLPLLVLILHVRIFILLIAPATWTQSSAPNDREGIHGRYTY
jgi:hypothetical protein